MKQDALKAGIVSIKYHPGDLSRIWVLDPFSDGYICVLAVNQHYTADLSLWKHQVIKRYIQQELKRQVDTEALVLAKARLQQFVTEEMRLTRKIRSRQSLARWWNEQVTTWIDQAAHTSSAHLSTSAQGAFPPQTIPDAERTPQSEEQPRSVADLSAPLPQVLEHVTILPDTSSAKSRTPFSAFPPLPVAHQSGETHPSTAPRPATRLHTPEQAFAQGATDVRLPSPESSSTNLQQTTIPLPKRQKRFGIEVRSTPWE